MLDEKLQAKVREAAGMVVGIMKPENSERFLSELPSDILTDLYPSELATLAIAMHKQFMIGFNEGKKYGNH